MSSTRVELKRVGTRGNEMRDGRNLPFNTTVEPIQGIDLTLSAQSFSGAYRCRVCIYVLIRVNVYSCICMMIEKL